MTINDMSTTDLAICAALERLAEENGRSARQARERGDKDEARFFQRGANAYVKALRLYRGGLRPELTEAGNWLLPSASGGPNHLLTKDGDWVCTCAAGTSMHWASALIVGIEIASDDLDRLDGGDAEDYSDSIDDDPFPLNLSSEDEGARSFGSRLCAARARWMEAA